MASFNSVTLIGNLTRDPELRFTPKGTAVAKVGLAVNRKWTTETGEKKEEVAFIDIDVFGKTAENCGQYLRKGSCALFAGRLKLDEWTDKQSGQKRSKLGVIAETVQFLDSKGSGGTTAAAPSQRSSRPASQFQDVPAPDAPPMEPEDRSVPF